MTPHRPDASPPPAAASASPGGAFSRPSITTLPPRSFGPLGGPSPQFGFPCPDIFFQKRRERKSFPLGIVGATPEWTRLPEEDVALQAAYVESASGGDHGELVVRF